MATNATAIEERVDELEERLRELEVAFVQTLRSRPGIGVTVEEARILLRQPVERGPEELELLRRFVGSFDGPRDLSTRMRDYLYGDVEDDDHQ
ncbi:MAG TPA: hypothetical protein VFL82_11935 [Thermomicrobiales bacterium]|nr:hypothetical protein [Thermomicrobiales bacterium]